MKRVMDEKKLGLDPVFGLPATRDTRAMDSARNRNICQDKRLQTALKTLDEDLNSKIVQCLNRLGREKHFLDKISPNPERKIALPPGFNAEEKLAVRSLRRGSLPSMSLSEFDNKLSSARNNRSATREQRAPDLKSKATIESELSEFQLRRKLYRGKSKDFENLQKTKTVRVTLANDRRIVTCYPLYRQKCIAGDAYQRVTSADVTRADMSRRGKRSHSNPEFSSESKQRKSPHEHFGDSHNATPRRQDKNRTPTHFETTVFPDHRSTSDRAFHFSSEEEQFSKLLKSFKTPNKFGKV